QHAPGTAVQGDRRRDAEAVRPHLSLHRDRARHRSRRTRRLGRARGRRRLLRPGSLRPRLPRVHGADADALPRRPATLPARAPRPCARQLAASRRLIFYKTCGSRDATMGPMGKVVMYSTVSVDGFIADENDQPGPLFDWLTSGDVPLDET